MAAKGAIYLRGKPGFENGINELHTICSIYGQGKYAETSLYTTVIEGKTIKSGGRCVELQDIERTVKTLGESKTYSIEEDGYVYTDGLVSTETSLEYYDYKNKKFINLTTESEPVTLKSSDTYNIKSGFWHTTSFGGGFWVANYNQSAENGIIKYGIYKAWNGEIDCGLYSVPDKGYSVHGSAYIKPVICLKADIALEYNNNTQEYTIR